MPELPTDTTTRRGPVFKVLRLLIGMSAVFFIVIAVILLGGMNFLAADSKIEKIVPASLGVYWALVVLIVLFFVNLRRRWREYVLFLGTVVMTCVTADLLVRRFLPYRAMMRYSMVASRDRHHRLPASKTMFRGYYEGIPTVVTTNEDGFRTTYSRADFLAHDRRIVVLGDSFTFGLGVTQEAACPQVLESMLRARLGDSEIAVLNAGLESYSPLLSLILMKNFMPQYRPNLVLFLLDATDFRDDARYTGEATFSGDSIRFDGMTSFHQEYRYYGALHEVFRPLTSELGKCLKFPFNKLNPPRYDFYKLEITVGNTRETKYHFIFRHPLELTRPYFEQTARYIGDINEECRKMGAPFLLVVTPRFQHWNPSECPDNPDGPELSRSEPYQNEYFRFFQELRERVPYDVLDILPAFQETDEYPLVFENDAHWNERGNALVARALADSLIENGYLR